MGLCLQEMARGLLTMRLAMDPACSSLIVADTSSKARELSPFTPAPPCCVALLDAFLPVPGLGALCARLPPA